MWASSQRREPRAEGPCKKEEACDDARRFGRVWDWNRRAASPPAPTRLKERRPHLWRPLVSVLPCAKLRSEKARSHAQTDFSDRCCFHSDRPSKCPFIFGKEKASNRKVWLNGMSLPWRRIAAFLKDYFRLRLIAREGVDFRLVSPIAVERDLEMMFAGCDQHGMEPASEIAAMAHVVVVDKNGRALGQYIQPQFGRIVSRIS